MNNNFNGNGGAAGKIGRVLLIALVALAAAGIASAQDNTDLKFNGGIGVIPVTGVAANGTINLNVSSGVLLLARLGRSRP